MDIALGPVPRPRRELGRRPDHDTAGDRPGGQAALPAIAPTLLTVRRYPVDKKNTKANKLLRDRYIKAKDPDDAGYYGDQFDLLVEETATIEDMEAVVAKLEAARAARKIVVPQIPSVPAPVPGPASAPSVPTPGTGPALSTGPTPPGTGPVVSAGPVVSTGPTLSAGPAPSTAPAKKVKPVVTKYTLGPSAYVATPTIAVDPYAGLSPKLRGVAVQITAWHTTGMTGISLPLTTSEQAALQAWVVAQPTASGKQKYVVNIGPGTGAYANKNQFKISGFGNVGGKAPTFHITL